MKKNHLIFILLVIANFAFAQTTINSNTVNEINLIDLLKTGGWAMWPLGLFSFFMITLIAQNTFSLRAKKLLREDFMPNLIDLMIQKKCKTALIFCKKNPCLFTNSLGSGLEKCINSSHNPDIQRMKESIEEATLEQSAALTKSIDYLSIIGASAPMLGLLGTVSGMIKAFQTMGTTGMGKPELLAANIGEALITTATGLIIAIPAMFFFFYYKKSFHKTLVTLGRNIGFLIEALEKGEQPISFLDIEEIEKMDGE